MPSDASDLRVEADEFAVPPWPPLRWLLRHPRVIDALIILVSVVPQAVILVAGGGEQPFTAYLTLALMAVALLWRRSRPFAVLIVLACAGVVFPDLNQTAALAFTMYSLAATASFRRVALGFGLGVIIPLVAAQLRLFLLEDAVIPSTTLDPFVLIAAAIGIAARSRLQRRQAVAELVNQRIENARVAERTRITAEMHDVVAHSLSVMIALADGASTARLSHPDRSAKALEQLAGVGRTALLDMQRILQLLRDADRGLDEALHASGHNIPSLEDLVEVFRSAGLPVTLARSGPPTPDDPALTMTIHRIVQEGLTNALRYATDATFVEVRIEHQDAFVEITITDDGRTGHPTAVGTGRGLIGIRERAAAYGGESEAGATARGGWRTRAVLRVPREPDMRP